MSHHDQSWFELVDLRRRKYATAGWIPLRVSETSRYPDGSEEIFALGSVAFPLQKKGEAERLGWSDLGISHDGGPYAFSGGGYKPRETFQYRDGEDLGADLIFDQSFGGQHPPIWHVNQDLILALGLLQEGDVWVRPDEGYPDAVVCSWTGTPLFRQHEAPAEIIRLVHRFRALDRNGVLALSKDIARMTADRIDVSALRKVVQPPKGEKWGSLKSLEKALSSTSSPEHARQLLTPLVGAYELRLGDAHLPSNDLDVAFGMVGIDPSASPISQGFQLIQAIVITLKNVHDAIAQWMNSQRLPDGAAEQAPST